MAEREHLFGDERPFAECHASTLALLPDGRLAAAWFGGTAERHPDTAIWFASRGEGGWPAPWVAARAREAPHWNPVLHQEPGGPLRLFFKVGPSPELWATWEAESRDGGATWSPPRELAPGDVGGRGPVKNKLIVLSDGAWLAPASLEGPGGWTVFADRSEDGGRTWQASPAPALDRARIAGAGVIQPALWESRPGHVHMLMRSSCGRVCRSDSADGGRTWSPVEPTDLPNNNSGLDLVRLEGGALVLACNPVAGDWAARTPLSLLRSDDGGATWRRLLDIEDGPGEYSYPAVVAVPGGVAVSYTWRRERIALWRGPAGG